MELFIPVGKKDMFHIDKSPVSHLTAPVRYYQFGTGAGSVNTLSPSKTTPHKLNISKNL